MIPASIPSPPIEWSTFSLGPLTIHLYALVILIGIGVAIAMTRARWAARGGDPRAVEDVVIWAIPFGIVGGRIYHVISTPGPYFGADGVPLDAFKIWEGGLGIWGAVALGAVGAYIGARRARVSFSAFMDSVAPAVLAAQAIGRLGNYFNHELYGAPTTLPWALEIDPSAFPPPEANATPYGYLTTYHPTFLYEMIWSIAGVFLILYLDRKLKLRFGRAFWLYVLIYTSGRLWIEMLRIDTAVHVLGLRINVWVSIVVLLGAIVAFVLVGVRKRGVVNDLPAVRTAAG